MVIGAGIVTAHAVPPAPQFSPAPATLPPVCGVIVSVYGGPVGGPPVEVNVAEHVFAASTWTAVVVLVPLHDPPQLVNAYPLAGAAVSVTGVALPNVTAQAARPSRTSARSPSPSRPSARARSSANTSASST